MSTGFSAMYLGTCESGIVEVRLSWHRGIPANAQDLRAQKPTTEAAS